MTYIAHPLRARLDWLHSLMQELEAAGVELPMGDYTEVYDVIEEARDEIAPDPFQETDLDAIDTPSYKATHRSKHDGSDAMFVAWVDEPGMGRGIVLMNENGDTWEDVADDWEAIA